MLTVNDLMTVIPNAVSPRSTLRQVIELMKTQACRQLPVLVEGKLVGIITGRKTGHELPANLARPLARRGDTG